MEVKPIPQPAYDATMNTPGEPFDMAFFVTPSVDFYDPYAFLEHLLREPFHRPHQLVEPAVAGSRSSPAYCLALRGAKRVKAYGQLDADLVRDAAPVVPLTYTERADARVEAGRLRPAATRARPRGGLL